MTDVLDPTAVERAEELDAADPLASFRDRFVVAEPGLVYLDGNSLGRLPRATVERLRRVVEDEWGRELIRGWDHWLDLPQRVGDRIAPLLGAQSGEVLVADSTTVNFQRLATAALDARPERRAVVTDRANFPTDRYVLENLAAQRGLELRWLDPDPVEGVQPTDVEAVLDDDVALVSFSHVNYRSAAVAELPVITALAHDAGALVAWDLSHAAGALEIGLTEAGVDLAVGCTYKFLHGGPGAPAFQYVRRDLQPELRNPIAGWFARREQFEMGQGFEAADGMTGWLAGTPGVLALAAVDEGVTLVAEAGIPEIRAKSVALSEYAVALHDAWLAQLGFSLGSPRDAARRGSHVAVRHSDARRLSDGLVARGVVPDFRAPDSIRLGLSPLTTSFADVRTGILALRELAGG
jgi:kynureninase